MYGANPSVLNWGVMIRDEGFACLLLHELHMRPKIRGALKDGRFYNLGDGGDDEAMKPAIFVV